ncbi:hypothetical protein NC651_025172 [Populus alba x Populus x berolinensis]|nr:hypothetical protein NC651_025172 [Populus alba x Populus x berolinensis]
MNLRYRHGREFTVRFIIDVVLQSTDQCGTPGAIIGSALTICEKKRKSLVPKLPINIVIIK